MILNGILKNPVANCVESVILKFFLKRDKGDVIQKLLRMNNLLVSVKKCKIKLKIMILTISFLILSYNKLYKCKQP